MASILFLLALILAPGISDNFERFVSIREGRRWIEVVLVLVVVG